MPTAMYESEVLPRELSAAAVRHGARWCILTFVHQSISQGLQPCKLLPFSLVLATLEAFKPAEMQNDELWR